MKVRLNENRVKFDFPLLIIFFIKKFKITIFHIFDKPHLKNLLSRPLLLLENSPYETSLHESLNIFSFRIFQVVKLILSKNEKSLLGLRIIFANLQHFPLPNHFLIILKNFGGFVPESKAFFIIVKERFNKICHLFYSSESVLNLLKLSNGIFLNLNSNGSQIFKNS